MRQPKIGSYMIYRLIEKETGKPITLFFLPDKVHGKFNLRRCLNRITTVQAYKHQGCVLAGVLYVDRESYLNGRLSYYVEKFLEEERQEQYYKTSCAAGKLKREVCEASLKVIKENKWNTMKSIASTIHRLNRSNYPVYNAVALEIYAEYISMLGI